MPPFDFTSVDWSDEDSSPFDQPCCDENDEDEFEQSSSSCCCPHNDDNSDYGDYDYYKAPVVAQRERTIRFAMEDQVYEIPNREDYSHQDVEATWYQREDFMAMRRQITHLLFLMESTVDNGTVLRESESLTTRGLEYRTDQGAMKRTHNKRDAYYAVLSEQERQWTNGYEDPESIAAVYKVVSTPCNGMATFVAVQDETAVRDYLKDTRAELLQFYHNNHNNNNATTTATECTENDDQDDNECYDFHGSITKPGLLPSSSLTRRMAVLEDIQVLSRATQICLTGPAAA